MTFEYFNFLTKKQEHHRHLLLLCCIIKKPIKRLTKVDREKQLHNVKDNSQNRYTVLSLMSDERSEEMSGIFVCGYFYYMDF